MVILFVFVLGFCFSHDIHVEIPAVVRSRLVRTLTFRSEFERTGNKEVLDEEEEEDMLTHRNHSCSSHNQRHHTCPHFPPVQQGRGPSANNQTTDKDSRTLSGG